MIDSIQYIIIRFVGNVCILYDLLSSWIRDESSLEESNGNIFSWVESGIKGWEMYPGEDEELLGIVVIVGDLDETWDLAEGLADEMGTWWEIGIDWSIVEFWVVGKTIKLSCFWGEKG